MTSPEIKNIECRFVIHLTSKDKNNRDDLHLIKEQITYVDGSKVPNLRFVKNYKRPFWITQEKYRNHESKKEWEDIDKLKKYECTQLELRDRVSKTLGQSYTTKSLREVCSSPYVYGADILSTACIKKLYRDKYPEAKSRYSIASLDIESNVDTGEIILITIVFDKKVFTSIYKPFIRNVSNLNKVLNEKVDEYIGEYFKDGGYTLETAVTDNQILVIKNVLDKLHEWQPDFVSIWNINYDIPEIIKVLESFNVSPEDIFSDPRVPKEYRVFWYKQGKNQKVTASGKITPMSPASQWHTLYTSSSFYFIDAMCAYKQNRIGRPEEPSYSLDFILNKELGLRKLKFKEADEYNGLMWHDFMQNNYPVEYIVYNIFDSLSMIELEKKTKDLSLTLPLFSDISDFSNYASQPRRAADKLHYYCLENDKVIGTTGRNMREALDDETMPLSNLIVTLPAYLVADNGLQCIVENPNIHTNIRIHQADLDIEGAYPSTQVASNVSKETTYTELVDIAGIDQNVYRLQNIGLSSGHVNALEYCQTMFNFPKLDKLLLMYNSSKSTI